MINKIILKVNRINHNINSKIIVIINNKVKKIIIKI